MIEPDNERNAVSPPATFADVGISLKDHQQLGYRGESPRLGFVHCSSLKEKPSFSTIARQSEKVRRTSFDEGLIEVCSRKCRTRGGRQ